MKLTEVISKEDYYDLYLTEDFKSKLKSLGLAGLFALGLTLGADTNAKPHSAEELQQMGFNAKASEFISTQDEKTQQMLIKAKQKETKAEPVKKSKEEPKAEPVKKSKEEPKAEPVNIPKIRGHLEMFAKKAARSVGFDPTMFGHDEINAVLSDTVKGAPKGNGYWSFNIKTKDQGKIPVVIGFKNYTIDVLKINGQEYNDQMKKRSLDIRSLF